LAVEVSVPDEKFERDVEQFFGGVALQPCYLYEGDYVRIARSKKLSFCALHDQQLGIT
jgi:hypothetical protein